MIALVLLGLAACGKTDDTACGGENSRCGDSQCEVASTTPVAWTDPTALGSADALFASVAGSCQAPFHWDGGNWAETATVEPAQGQSTITVTVALDPSSSRVVTYTPEGAMCPSQIQVDGTVTLELPEGKIVERWPVTFSSGDLATGRVSVNLNEADFGAWLSISKLDPATTLSMSISLTTPNKGCAGEIRLSYQRGEKNAGSGASGPLASWSSTGCSVGTVAVDLAQPWQEMDIAAAIASTFGQATLPGTWGDGTATSLALTTTVSSGTVCAEVHANGANTVVVPVDVVASTADARVRGLVGKGNVRAMFLPSGLSQLQLWLSTDLVCASTADVLPYTGADCATVKRVTAQLGLNHYLDEPTINGGELTLYLYQRQGVGEGAADRVDKLVLSP